MQQQQASTYNICIYIIYRYMYKYICIYTYIYMQLCRNASMEEEQQEKASDYTAEETI